MPAVCWSGLTLGRAGERSASHGRAIALSPPRANTTVNSAGEISRGEVNNQKQKRKRKKEREITAGGIFRYNFTLWTERRPETELQQQLRGGCSSQRQSRGGGGGLLPALDTVEGCVKRAGWLFLCFPVLWACHCLPVPCHPQGRALLGVEGHLPSFLPNRESVGLLL